MTVIKPGDAGPTGWANGVDITLAGLSSGKLDATTAAATYATLADTRFGLDPDTFSGTDYQRVQAALDYSIAHGFPAVVFRRQFDITGAGPLSINKAAWTDRSVIHLIGHGGGITKTDAGAMFTSAITNMGDISTVGMSYISTQGAGTVIWDCNQLIRISSMACEYVNIDAVLVATGARYAQSVKFIAEHITGGAGYAFQAPKTYDVTIKDCLVEVRAGGLFSNMVDQGISQNDGLRIKDNLVENCSAAGGSPIVLAGCWVTDVSGNYFEENFDLQATPQIDTSTLCASTGQIGLALKNNIFVLSTYQIANNVAAVWVGGIMPETTIVSDANASTGILYEIKTANGRVLSTGDYANGLLVKATTYAAGYVQSRPKYLGTEIAIAGTSPTVNIPMVSQQFTKTIVSQAGGAVSIPFPTTFAHGLCGMSVTIMSSTGANRHLDSYLPGSTLAVGYFLLKDTANAAVVGDTVIVSCIAWGW